MGQWVSVGTGGAGSDALTALGESRVAAGADAEVGHVGSSVAGHLTRTDADTILSIETAGTDSHADVVRSITRQTSAQTSCCRVLSEGRPGTRRNTNS